MSAEANQATIERLYVDHVDESTSATGPSRH
jgi:hypothetical protein